MNLHKLEDTFEKQERKELIFELCYKLIPLVFLLFLFLLILMCEVPYLE